MKNPRNNWKNLQLKSFLSFSILLKMIIFFTKKYFASFRSSKNLQDLSNGARLDASKNSIKKIYKHHQDEFEDLSCLIPLSTVDYRWGL